MQELCHVARSYLECQSGKVLQEVTGFTANGEVGLIWSVKSGLTRSNRFYSEWWVLTTTPRVIIIVIHQPIGLDDQPCLHWFP